MRDTYARTFPPVGIIASKNGDSHKYIAVLSTTFVIVMNEYTCELVLTENFPPPLSLG
jgi:hypothetical protein